MKTATITFHASHNYGSMLQAFALQTIIQRLGFENEIINLRTLRQKELYSYRYRYTNHNFIKRLVANLITYYYLKDVKRKSILFERFLSEDLRLTREYASAEELQLADLDYDCFISGGDQIWNTGCIDFDWSFYLSFVKKGKKISYAVSMGPRATEDVIGLDKVAGLLKQYDHIAVREEGTQKIVEDLIGHPVSITLDPVLLLDSTDWQKHYAQEPIIKGDYILLYVPGYRRDEYKIASMTGRILHQKVISTLYAANTMLYPNIRMHCATGPWEFLNLLQHARMAVCGSYHAVLFSMLFQKPFLAVNGAKDNRMRTILQNTGLLNRVVSVDSISQWSQEDLLHCDFSQAHDYIAKERIKSIEYLKHSITD